MVRVVEALSGKEVASTQVLGITQMSGMTSQQTAATTGANAQIASPKLKFSITDKGMTNNSCFAR